MDCVLAILRKLLELWFYCDVEDEANGIATCIHEIAEMYRHNLKSEINCTCKVGDHKHLVTLKYYGDEWLLESHSIS